MTLLETAKGLLVTAHISVATVADATLGRLDPTTSDERLRWWSNKLLRDANATVEVRGRENLPEGRETFLVMSNHQSLYDIPVLYHVIPRRLRMVAKAELFEVPVWGHAMKAAGFVRVDRGDRTQAVESLRRGGAMLEEGTLLWIAPEGTRSPTGLVGPFKSGGFHLALATGHRILPIAIDGTRDILPAGGTIVRRDKRVVVTVLPPIDPKTYGTDRRKELMDAVRDAIVGAIGR
jgi:1-acyl-sn-glycerol-3-phosphate acyltransferase